MSLQACAEMVRRGDPDRFLSAMTAPSRDRAMLFPLYAFNLEIARAAWLTDEPMIAEMRLQWWREAVQEIAGGQRARAHEVVTPLARVMVEMGLPTELFDSLIVARRWEIHRDPFADRAHFDRFINQTSGHLMWLSAMALGASDDLEAPVRDAGFAMGLANWLLAVPELTARGRHPLVETGPDALRALARGGLGRIRSARRTQFGAATPALRAAWRAKARLLRAASDPGRVASGGLDGSEIRRRGSLLCKSIVGGW